MPRNHCPSDYVEKTDAGLNGTIPPIQLATEQCLLRLADAGLNMQDDEPGFQSPGGQRPAAAGMMGLSPGHQASTLVDHRIRAVGVG